MLPISISSQTYKYDCWSLVSVTASNELILPKHASWISSSEVIMHFSPSRIRKISLVSVLLAISGLLDKKSRAHSSKIKEDELEYEWTSFPLHLSSFPIWTQLQSEQHKNASQK